ncbi:hypothetical protein SNE35_19635 [Paucibacter sp. R3-3]|uniref:DUF11 domain-containing protein n=1 Tax=Roseateles agri TaxID=3098619 RepID=A0ABU5DLY5_9BURK|nr:hypothetical protein [Paucibacter sp. R3-3]MDY0746733.1 hypothetical protein [Paucibacter sp. R3-3]
MLASALLFALLLCALPARAACSGQGCVSAGPRLLSVDSTRGALLNALLGSLTNSTLTLGVADWNSLATGDLSLLRTVSALQGQLNASTPAATLTSNVTVLDILTAATTGATAEGKTQLAATLNSLKLPLSGLSTPIQLGQLLQSNGILGTTRVNALELVTGVIQLYNSRNVLSTPNAITLSGSSIGLGSLLGSVTLQAQVIEPPVIVCGGVGSTFHSAALRVKLGVDLISLNLDVSVLTALLGGGISANVGHLDVYVEVARTDGVISALNAVSGAVTVQATPGVAALYLGSIADSLYWNRSRAINPASDLGFGTIGALKVGALNVDLLARASAVGSALGSSTLTLMPASPTGTVYANAGFVTTLLSSLIANLELSLGPGLLTSVANSVIGLLKPVLQLALTGPVGNLVTGLVNPLLNLLGIRLGETDISAQGAVWSCAVSGTVYEDANHNAALDGGESGTGLTLYAKLVPATQPAGPALAVVAITPSSGAFSFASVAAAAYTVVVNGNASATDLTPAMPAGWLGTEQSSLTRSFTLSAADVPGQRFGLFHGSRVAGLVFKDSGAGGGTPNNGLRDGAEATLPGVALQIADAGGTVLDRATTGDAGAYLLWIPSTASGVLKIGMAAADAGWVVVSGAPGTTGGSFTAADGTLAFTPASGSSYTGANLGQVPANVLQPDGQQTILAGSFALYPHTFTAGSGGSVSLAAAAALPAGWSYTVHRDLDCNGRIDPTDDVLPASIPMTADQKLCVIVRINAPAGAPDGSKQPFALTASFAYANTALTRDQQRTDVTTIGPPTAAGLQLVKTVDRAAARSGDVITYTIAFANLSSDALSGIKITDATPAYTVFQSASCGAMPSAQLVCTVSVQPAAGGTGRVEWSLAGPLGSGLGGQVVLVVKLQ